MRVLLTLGTEEWKHPKSSVFVILSLLFTMHLSDGRSIGQPSAASRRWGYQENTDEKPPQKWENLYPACKGARQSPILINKASVKESPQLGPLQFQSYGAKPKDKTWNVLNNGQTVEFSGAFDSKQQPTLRKGGLPADYIFTQFHFHWGNSSKRGSEHVIDNQRFPLELHIVHRKMDKDDAQAQQHPSGMAVLSVLFELTTEKNKANKQVDSVIRALNKVITPNKPTNLKLEKLNLKEFLPRSAGFYRYMGLLTTPPCAEAVEWSVLDKTQYITERQLKAFQALRGPAGGSSVNIGYNYRPLQALNNRVIKHYTVQDEADVFAVQF